MPQKPSGSYVGSRFGIVDSFERFFDDDGGLGLWFGLTCFSATFFLLWLLPRFSLRLLIVLQVTSKLVKAKTYEEHLPI